MSSAPAASADAFSAARPDSVGCRPIHVVSRSTAWVRPGTLNTSDPVFASIATVVPAYEPMTGDYGAVDREGRGQSLVSYGAVFAEFRDSATGALVNVAPGQQATVMIPLHSYQRENAPTAIPLWSYDMKNGRWVEEGLAKLETVDGLPMYVGTTTHFSTINADLAFGASANCLRVRVDPLKLPPGITLRVQVPVGGGAPQVFDVNLNSDQFHGLFRLPQASTVILTLLDTLGNPIPGGSTNVNMAARPQLAGSDALSVPYPYTACGVPIDLGLSMPAYAESSQGNPYFLTGPYGAFLPPSSSPAVDITNKYYLAIDPNGLRETLSEFWLENGFDPLTGAGGTRAAYLNHNDLGLGRDMHCLKKVNGNVACYVTNYGQPDQNPLNADKALTANPLERIATVAMEYSPIENAPIGNTNTKVVKFYVYTGGTDTSPRREDAVLDAFGPKYVPYLCAVCHGGYYLPADPLNPTYDEVRMGASDFDPGAGPVFREFDLESFRYPGSTSYPPTAPTGQGSLTDFRDLNLMVRDTLPSGHAVRNLIETWYPGLSSTPDLTTPVPGWGPAASPQDGLYKNVVAPSCRTCHAARAGLDFGSYARLQAQPRSQRAAP